jgi:hypothetical protein
MVGISVPDWIKGIYESRGWHQQNPSYLNRRHGVRVMISPCGLRAVAAIPPVRINPSSVGGMCPQDQFDDYLRKVQKGLERILASGMTIQDIYFTGGGTLVIPDWFTAWCAQNGINIQVVDPNDLNSATVSSRTEGFS